MKKIIQTVSKINHKQELQAKRLKKLEENMKLNISKRKKNKKKS
tara:strand:- start:1025 stop:1156 length:132 start_codon:yes stop_codon:yes gene_type:complete